MKITRKQLRQIIKEELEIHLAPEDLNRMSPDEAYGMGYLKGQDMQCDHPDWSPTCTKNDSVTPGEAAGIGYAACKDDLSLDDPDLDDDGFLSVAELVSMVHNITDDVSLESSPPMSSMIEPLLRAIAESKPEGLTAEDLRNMPTGVREELRLQLSQAAAHAERAIKDAINRG